MFGKDEPLSPDQQVAKLRKKILKSKPSKVDRSEMLKMLRDIEQAFQKLIDDDNKYLLEQCDFIHEFLNSGHEISNENNEFLYCIVKIIDADLEFNNKTEEKYLSTIVKLKMFSPNVRKIAKNLFLKEAYERAITWYEALFDIGPTGVAVWMDYINIFKELDDPQAVIGAFEKALSAIDDKPWIRNNYANYLFQQQRFSEAEAQLHTALLEEEKDKLNSSLYYEYATTLLDKIYQMYDCEEEKKLRRIFNYDAMLSANINQQQVRSDVKEIISSL